MFPLGRVVGGRLRRQVLHQCLFLQYAGSVQSSWSGFNSVECFCNPTPCLPSPPLAPHLQEGDSVVIGDTEFEWSDDRSERAMYDAWLKDMDARGANLQGSARWPSSRPRADS
jgi:hypothetical protein